MKIVLDLEPIEKRVMLCLSALRNKLAAGSNATVKVLRSPTHRATTGRVRLSSPDPQNLPTGDVYILAATILFEKAHDDVTPAMRRVAKRCSFGYFYGNSDEPFDKWLTHMRPLAQHYMELENELVKVRSL